MGVNGYLNLAFAITYFPFPAFGDLASIFIVDTGFSRREGAHKCIVVVAHVCDDLGTLSRPILGFFCFLLRVMQMPAIQMVDQAPIFLTHDIKIPGRFVHGSALCQEMYSWTSVCLSPSRNGHQVRNVASIRQGFAGRRSNCGVKVYSFDLIQGRLRVLFSFTELSLCLYCVMYKPPCLIKGCSFGRHCIHPYFLTFRGEGLNPVTSGVQRPITINSFS